MSTGYTVKGEYYPTIVEVAKAFNMNYDTLRRQLKYCNGDIVRALEWDVKDKYRFTLDEHFLTIEEHCKRLSISYSKVTVYIHKHKMSVEDAIEKAKVPTRYTKHTLSGVSEVYGEFSDEVRRNKSWWEFFGIKPKSATNLMSKDKLSMIQVLKRKGIDMRGLTLTPFTG